jgi:hypothetical protein
MKLVPMYMILLICASHIYTKLGHTNKNNQIPFYNYGCFHIQDIIQNDNKESLNYVDLSILKRIKIMADHKGFQNLLNGIYGL